MSYHQFTSDERKCLWELHRKNLSIRKIADALGRAPSSVSRELRRNRVRKERGILSLPTKRRRHGADISATLLSRLTLS